MRLPLWMWLVAAVLVAWGATTANPLITVFSLALLPVLALLVWRPGEPPVLLFACVMQWLQAAADIYYENSRSRTLDVAFNGPQLAEATWLSLLGVLVLAFGIRAAFVRVGRVQLAPSAQEAQSLSPGSLFVLYLVLFILCSIVRSIASGFPALAQALIAATSLQWIPVILLAEAVLTQGRGYGLLALVVLIEFCTGLLGYFSNFKNIFFILSVLLLASPGRLPKRRWLVLGGIVAFLLLASSAWTSIKIEYRDFLNKGAAQQVVMEPVSARASKLAELVGSLDGNKLADGFEETVQRISYVTYFAHCIANVPDNLPFENGALWFGAVEHVFMPRLLFPNKPALDDSARTVMYAGVNVTSQEEGASIGLGYMAESYIDFGPYFMFIPVFLLGLFYGLIYRLFAFRKSNRLLGMACAIAILVFGAYTIETSNVKLIGGNTMSVLVLGLFYWRLGPAFSRWVSHPQSRPARPARRTAAL